MTSRRNFLKVAPAAVAGVAADIIVPHAILYGPNNPGKDPFMPSEGFDFAQTVQLYNAIIDPNDIIKGSQMVIAVHSRRIVQGDNLSTTITSSPLKIREEYKPYVPMFYDFVYNEQTRQFKFGIYTYKIDFAFSPFGTDLVDKNDSESVICYIDMKSSRPGMAEGIDVGSYSEAAHTARPLLINGQPRKASIPVSETLLYREELSIARTIPSVIVPPQ